ncbi:hypothetical protein [Methylobacterium sp. Leaf85]|jgi:hypothetical protein|uniref:hypothetical protein n=1 Tax=Methylobacterium sp. Leaf85 TaxID=1736241 RepID=UPI0006F796EB|nr:hypothetical protein [Methylobacterium sp. Leaf85]KQO44960.1 hypothetical protein ASF08_08055 [Methylobacterium sp. Leaf85]
MTRRPFPLRGVVALAAILIGAPAWSGPACAGGLSTDISPCGGDAYSSAEVIEGQRSRRGPLVAMPDTLCADLAPQRPADPVEIYVDPYGQRGGGYRGGGAPYGGETQRGVRPPGRPLRSDD